jgi:hypothetical protein
VPVAVLAAVAVLEPPAEQEYHMIHRKERPLESELHNLDNSYKYLLKIDGLIIP